jgi:hypothetical protein
MVFETARSRNTSDVDLIPAVLQFGEITMSRIVLRIVSCALLCVSGISSAAGSEPADGILEALQVPILAPQQTLEETRRFAAARIPQVPAFQTAEEWQKYADVTRKAALERVVFRGVAEEWRKAWTKVERLDVIEGGPGYKIQKLRLEVLPELWIPALLYLPDTVPQKAPVFLNVNGHDPLGKAAEYKQARCIHMARNGIIALNLEWFGMGQLRTPGFVHGRMNQLDLCGASGIAPFYLAMSRSLDFLLSLENADSTRVGVAGLSGGGWQTIFISSLDTRVTLCNPVAGYSSFRTRIDNFSDLGDSEQTPVDLGITSDYAQLTAMLAPRAALLTFNEKDNCCFASGHALEPLVQAASPAYALFNQQARLRTHVNSDPGDHNFLLDNRKALYRMIRDHWYEGSEQAFATEELPVDKELKNAEQLQVAMPTINQDFHTLAIELSESLPRTVARPSEKSAMEQWRKAEQEKLRAVVRPISETVTGEKLTCTMEGAITVTQWKLNIGNDWNVPAVEFAKDDSTRWAIVMNDEGRKQSADKIRELLQQGHRVLAVDPFYFGESSFAELGYLWALMVSTVGERPLGVQAGQILSITDWIHQEFQPSSISLVTSGPRTGVIGLVARALNPERISGVEEIQPLGSLKDVIHGNYVVEQAPELFCAGLLEITDLAQLRELANP